MSWRVELLPSEQKAAIARAVAYMIRGRTRGYIIDDFAREVAEKAVEYMDADRLGNARARREGAAHGEQMFPGAAISDEATP